MTTQVHTEPTSWVCADGDEWKNTQQHDTSAAIIAKIGLGLGGRTEGTGNSDNNYSWYKEGRRKYPLGTCSCLLHSQRTRIQSGERDLWPGSLIHRDTYGMFHINIRMIHAYFWDRMRWGDGARSLVIIEAIIVYWEAAITTLFVSSYLHPTQPKPTFLRMSSNCFGKSLSYFSPMPAVSILLDLKAYVYGMRIM